MAIIERTAWSAEMEKNAAVVGRMTGGAVFTTGGKSKNGKKSNPFLLSLGYKSLRLTCDLGYSLMPKEKGVKVQPISLDGIHGEITLPKKQVSENIIFYIHGGGLVSGSAKGTRAYCSMMAKYSGCRVVSIDYALAPERHYPDALSDCAKAFLALRKQFPKAKYAVQGESAGGYLTTALTIRMIETGHQPPEVIIPHSPVCDFTGETKSDYYPVHDVTVTREGLEALVDCYCPGQDTTNPEISVIRYGHFDKFPPTTITCDANETLRADAEALYNKLIDAGVDATLLMYHGTFHAFAPIGTSSPETMELLIDNIHFMKRCWGEEQ